jgi:hypothetical protein
MKQNFLMTTVGAVAGLWLASAQAAVPNPQFLGTWKVDLSTIQPPPEGDPKKAPKSVTVTVKDVGGGKWTTEIVIEMADGTKQTRPPQPPVSVDGKPTPVSGNLTMDSVTLSCPEPNTAVVTALKDGKPVSTETSKLSADGKRMVHTIDATGPDGNPLHITEILNKK